MSRRFSILCFTGILILSAAVVPIFSAGIDMTQDDFAFWYNLIDAEEKDVENFFGTSFTEISPEDLKSNAERIIWYKRGLTLWFDNGRVVQLRLDSNTSGSAGGLRIGSSEDDIRMICGRPWIEAEGSLYYNLPWRSGPVRLRFVFNGSGLREVYLYIVR